MASLAFLTDITTHYIRICELSSSFAKEIGSQIDNNKYTVPQTLEDCVQKVTHSARKLLNPLEEITTGRLKIGSEKLSKLQFLQQEMEEEKTEIINNVKWIQKQKDLSLSFDPQNFSHQVEAFSNANLGLLFEIELANSAFFLPPHS